MAMHFIRLCFTLHREAKVKVIYVVTTQHNMLHIILAVGKKTLKVDAHVIHLCYEHEPPEMELRILGKNLGDCSSSCCWSWA